MSRAAAILFLPLLILFLFTNLQEQSGSFQSADYIEIQAPAGSRTFMELADGTKVWLNQGSTLKYPGRFENNYRKVYLSGEAYFDVITDETSPFVVETNRITIKATGTEFNVMSYPDEEIIETTLVEGKVTLYDNFNNNREIKSLTVNESLKFDKRANTFKTLYTNTTKNISWKDGILIFRNDPLEDIAGKLGRWYNAEFVFKDEQAKRLTCTAIFGDETLPQVLELLEMATPVQFTLLPRKKSPDGVSYAKQKVVVSIGSRN